MEGATIAFAIVVGSLLILYGLINLSEKLVALADTISEIFGDFDEIEDPEKAIAEDEHSPITGGIHG